jgi:hypothetical protein
MPYYMHFFILFDLVNIVSTHFFILFALVNIVSISFFWFGSMLINNVHAFTIIGTYLTLGLDPALVLG